MTATVTVYELWETDSANLGGSYPSQDDALAVVSDVVQSLGKAAAATLVHTREVDDRTDAVASGEHLVELATSIAPITP
ncbi:MAG TPA: hypothetical protein VGR16_15480 [Thermomicrobiales bacterium]|nr:hypothetical protein [Thermomicrobiales bacterium]